MTEGTEPTDTGPSDTARIDGRSPEAPVVGFSLDESIGFLVYRAQLAMKAELARRFQPHDITPEQWKKVLGINLDGIFYTSQEAAKRMLSQGSGVILMTASTNGVVGHPFYADYNASKAGVNLLARTMALELAPTIRVNTVCPGYVLTPMQIAEYTPEMLEQVNENIPLKRHALPEEVAGLYAFLASDFSLINVTGV